MSLFTRFGNLIKGFFGAFLGEAEAENPDLVYQNVINDRVNQYNKLMKAVSGIVYLRNKLEKDLDEKTKQLTQIHAQIPIAIQQGEEAAALHLIERKNALTGEVEYIKTELEKVKVQAEDAKGSLVTFQSEIEKLKADRDTMLARREHARARLRIQEQLSGLSTDENIRALDGVRESIHKLEAQADVASEINGAGMNQTLKQIQAATSTNAARAELDEIKRQMQAGQNPNTEKTL
jgi:phage shock protein A